MSREYLDPATSTVPSVALFFVVSENVFFFFFRTNLQPCSCFIIRIYDM